MKAFEIAAYSSSELGQSILPGIDGTCDRVTCNTEMSPDVKEAAMAMAASDEEGDALASTMNAFEEAVLAMPSGDEEPQYGVRYCRTCELSCPVGRRSHEQDRPPAASGGDHAQMRERRVEGAATQLAMVVGGAATGGQQAIRD